MLREGSSVPSKRQTGIPLQDLLSLSLVHFLLNLSRLWGGVGQGGE